MKIGVISDIHFGKLSCTPDFSVPGEAVCNQNSIYRLFETSLIQNLSDEKVSLLLVAGDLTSVASPQEFYYCEEKILNIAQSAKISDKNVICCMGNHDVDWNVSDLSKKLSNGLPDSSTQIIEQQYLKLASYASECNLPKLHLPELNGPVPFSGVVKRDKVVVFILNSGFLCGREQPYPHGKLSNEQLKWFEKEAIIHEKDDDVVKIILLHHHPFQYAYPSPVDDPSMLAESGELLEIAGKYGIDLIIHGHRHHPKAQTRFDADWKKPITFLCAGSLAVNAAERVCGSIPNTFHVIDLQNAPNYFVLHNYEYNIAHGWIRTHEDRAEVPLDGEMYLGKLFTSEDYDKAAQEVIAQKCSKDCTLLNYCDLPECLKFMHHKDLNSLFQRLLPTQQIVGKFPEPVGIFKK